MTRITQLAPAELAEFRENHPNAVIIDVREAWEHEIVALDDALLLPLGSVALRAEEELPDRAAPIIVYCHHGIRSLQACAVLNALGYGPLYNLSGGIDRYSAEVDPSMPTY